jgi:hypothetical protein
MVEADLRAQRDVLFLVYDHPICPVSLREDQSPQPIDFEGELSVLLSKLLNLNQHSSDLFFYLIAGFSFI